MCTLGTVYCCALLLRHLDKLKKTVVPFNSHGCGVWESVCESVSCTYELGEASHRQPTGSCHKLKQTDPLLVVHLFHHLQEHNAIIH